MEYVNNIFAIISTIKPKRLKITKKLIVIISASFKIMSLLIFFTLGIVLSLVLRLVLLFTSKWFYIKINTKYILRPLSRYLLFLAGVKINKTGNVDITNAIIVSNHWGYIDSLVLMALSPCIVISNVDVMQLPFIGKIMMLMGFVFVDRKNKRSIPIVLERAAIILNRTNLNIAFFPEGGTGDGYTLRKFKSSFFDLAFMAKKNIAPVVIQIETINNKTPTEDNINRVVYHNYSGSLFHHILNVIRLKSIEVSYHVLPQISYYEVYSKYLSRKKICKMAEEEISDFLNKNKRY